MGGDPPNGLDPKTGASRRASDLSIGGSCFMHEPISVPAQLPLYAHFSPTRCARAAGFSESGRGIVRPVEHLNLVRAIAPQPD
jgi:hypothetical protein